MGSDYANLLLKFFVADRVCNGFIVPVVVTLQIASNNHLFYIFTLLELAALCAVGLVG